MRQRDVVEFLAGSHASTQAELVDLTMARYPVVAEQGYVATTNGGRPVAFGAMVEARPRVVTLLFFATDEFPKIVAELTTFIRARLFPTYRNHGVHRIECVSHAGYEDAHRWIEILGLQREAVLLGYGKDGEAFIQFSWVRNVR